MLGLGSSIATSSGVSVYTPFDSTWTFTSAADVTPWTASSGINSVSYLASAPIGGSTYADLMAVNMTPSSPAGTATLTLSGAFETLGKSIDVKYEVDYGIGKNNDSTLRISTLTARGVSGQVSPSNLSPNNSYTVAPATVLSIATADDDLVIGIPKQISATASDKIFIQRIRVYEV